MHSDQINYLMEELKIVHKLHQKLMLERCQGITGEQAKLLFFIKNNKMNQKKLAKLLHVTEATLSVRIKRLVDMGLIEREIDIQDKRNYSLILSLQGEKMVSNVDKSVMLTQDVICKNITKSEYNTIVSVIKKIQNNLKEEMEC